MSFIIDVPASVFDDRDIAWDLFCRSSIAYLVTDAAGIVARANLAATTLLDCSLDDLRGQPVIAFAQDVSRRRLRSAMRALDESDDALAVRINLQLLDGHVSRVEARLHPTYDSDGLLSAIHWLVAEG